MYGTIANSNVFIQRYEGVEISLMIEIIDYHQIVYFEPSQPTQPK